MKNFYFITLLVFSAIWSNARMLDQLAGYPIFHVFDLPREIRFIEFIIVLGFFIFSYFKNKQNKEYIEPEYLFIPWILPVIALTGGLLNNVGMTDIFQGLYLYTSPLLVFYTALWLKIESKDLLKLRTVVFIIMLFNIPAWIYEVNVYYSFDGNGDNVNGMLRDAHLFAAFFYFGVIYCFSLAILKRSIIWAIGAILFFIVGFMAINEKATLFLGPILFSVLVGITEIKLKRLILPLLLFGLIGYAAYSVGESIMAKTDTKIRVDIFEDNDLSDIGTIVAYVQLPLVFAEVPTALIYGAGSGNYGSSIALRRNVEGTETDLSKRYVGDLELAGAVGAFAWKTNYLIGTLVEFGLIFTFILLSFYYRVGKRIVFVFKTIAETEDKGVISYVLGSLALLWMTALVSNISNLDEGILVYPIMIAAAVICGKKTDGENREMEKS